MPKCEMNAATVPRHEFPARIAALEESFFETDFVAVVGRQLAEALTHA